MIRSSLCSILVALSLGTAVSAEGAENAGKYLAAQHAGYQSDFAKAAEYYTRALALDPSNTVLMERALTAEIALGRFDRVNPLLRRLEATDTVSPLANIARFTQLMAEDDFAGASAAFDDGFTLGALLDGLVQPWVELGEGKMSAALEGFDALEQQPGLHNIALYHKALALASVGDFGGADEILSGRADGSLTMTPRGALAQVQVLSQLERNDDALSLIEQAYGNNPPPVFAAAAKVLEAGETLPFDVVPNAKSGTAEAFFTVAQALIGDGSNTLTLIYSRTASEIDPQLVDALLLTASLLENETQYDLATEVYDLVPRDHPSFLVAEFGRADALRQSGRNDAAIEVLRQLSKSYPDLALVHESLGDMLRRDERWAEASAAYDRAINLIGTPRAEDWGLFYVRGIVRERQQNWEAAEADFRLALELVPNQPQVLNYLGYSMVEQRINLDEALGMIQTAVDARPDEGFIIDSLGWVLYRLGRYSEAVEPMERAVELMAVDPVVNDHLGDVYWAVGRKREAEFQWRRALSFVDYGSSNEDVDPDRIRRKLDVGLDTVLEEEGAAPLVRPTLVSD